MKTNTANNNAPTMTNKLTPAWVYENPTFFIVDLGKGDDVITGSAIETFGEDQETPGSITW